jgi:Uma2 family endonuclease
MADIDVLTSPHVLSSTALRHRFTVDEYYAMAEAGILNEDDRVELIEGEIIEMSPINAPHAGHVKRLIRLFTKRLGDKMLLDVQNPVRLGDYSEPQPDIALLKPRADDYTKSHPKPADVKLLVEVSDSTVDYDRDVKAPLYARAKISEMWLANLPEKRLEVFRDPSPKGYKTRQLLEHTDTISPLAFPEVTFRVSEIVG